MRRWSSGTTPRCAGEPVAVGVRAKRGVVAAGELRGAHVRGALGHAVRHGQADLRRAGVRAAALRGLRAVSRQIRAIFAGYTPLVEPLSLDEAYLDVTENLRGIPTASATAREIRARILEETGLTASAGVSCNKFLAKLASDHRKPNGQFVMTPAMGAAFVEALPVAKFHGIGPVTAAKMRRLGIETGADLRSKSLAFLEQHFGRSRPGIWTLRTAGTTGPWLPTGPQIVGLGDDLRARPDAARRRRSRGAGHG